LGAHPDDIVDGQFIPENNFPVFIDIDQSQLSDYLNKAVQQGRRIHYLPPYRGEHQVTLLRLLGIAPEAQVAGASTRGLGAHPDDIVDGQFIPENNFPVFIDIDQSRKTGIIRTEKI